MRFTAYLFLATVLVAIQGCAGSSTRTFTSAGENSAGIYSVGMQTIDTDIEAIASARILRKYKGSHITITSYNRRVLVIGEAPNQGTKTGVEHIIRAVPNVQEITNEISVGVLSNSKILRSDARITRKIKYYIRKNKTINAGVIKIATIKGVVYLLGLVTHAEANAASEIASTTPRVTKVIRAFAYID